MFVSDPLDLTWLGNRLTAWLLAGAILVGAWLALVLARRLVLRRLERFAPRTATSLDDLALDAVRRTGTLFLLVVAVALAARVALVLPENARAAVGLLARVAFLLQAAAWGNGAIRFWTARAARATGEHDRASITTIHLLAIVAQVVLWTLIGLLALDAFGVNVTALVTGLGIAGVAVALAVQNVLGDLLASLSIALDKPFVVGDYIVFDAFMGTVENIGLKTTRLRSLSGEQIVVANAELLKKSIRNYQRQVERRVAFTLTFPLDTPPDVMERIPPIVRETVTANAQTRLDRTHFATITDQTLAVETVYFVTTADYNTYMDIQQRINLALLRRFGAEGIHLAVPTRSVVVRPTARAGDRADGDGDGDAPPAARRAAAAGGA